MGENKNTRIFLQNPTLQNGLKKFLHWKKLKNFYCGHKLKDPKNQEIVGIFVWKNLQKTNRTEIRSEKVIKKKEGLP